MQIVRNPNVAAQPFMPMRQQYQFFKAMGTVTLIFVNYLILSSATEQLEKGRVKHNPASFFFEFLFLTTIVQIASICFMNGRELNALKQKNRIHGIFDDALKFVMVASLATMASSEIFSSGFPKKHTFVQLTVLSIFPVIWINETQPIRNFVKKLALFLNAIAVGVLAYDFQSNALNTCRGRQVNALANQLSECIQMLDTQKSYIIEKCRPMMNFGISLGTLICNNEEELPFQSCLSREGKKFLRLHVERMDSIYWKQCPNDIASYCALGVLFITMFVYMTIHIRDLEAAGIRLQ